MRSALTAILFCIASITSFSQGSAENKEVVIHLKDGSMLRGEAIEHTNESVRLVIISGDTIDIKRSVMKGILSDREYFHYPNRRYHFKDGQHIDFNYGFGISSSGGAVMMDFSINHRFTPKIGAGIGIGVQNNSLIVGEGNSATPTSVFVNASSFPLFAQGKYYLNRNRRSLYVHARAGYTFGDDSAWNENRTVNDGILINYGIGFTRATKHRIKTFFQLSQLHNYATGKDISWNQNGPIQYEYELWFNRLSFVWGLEFNMGSKPRNVRVR